MRNIKSLFLHKFYCAPSSDIDILIIDESGSEIISHCIPNYYKVGILKTRGVIPYVKKISFVWGVVAAMARYGLSFQALIIPVVESISPKLIITFTDNTPLMGMLNDTFPDIVVISVQNGMRYKKDWKFSYPILFVLGEQDKNYINQLDLQVSECYPIGSLRAGIFLDSAYMPISRSNQSICFVSQYREHMEFSKNVEYSRFFQTGRVVYAMLVDYCKFNRYALKVPMVCEHESCDKEMQYFNYPHSSDAIELIFNDAKKLSSYEAAFSSSIIVGMDSTLLFEMLGLGKKVLFCVQSDTLLKDMRTDNFYEKMPSELLLEEMDIQALEKKMDALKNMSDKKYALLIKDAQLHYMNFQSSRPHKVIAEYIDNALQGKE